MPSRPLTLQQRKLEENQQFCFVTCSCLALGPAIAALVVGVQYDEASPCNDGTDYTIDLKSYLLIAGGVGLGWIGFSCCMTLCAFWNCSDLHRVRFQSALFMFGSLPVLFWSFIWSIVGFYIVEHEMSDDCAAEPIGAMILAWCTINTIFVGFGLCLILCLCCAACVEWFGS